MSKRKSSKGGANLYYGCAALLALVAVIMIFVVNLKIVGSLTEVVYYENNGLNAIFGFKDGNIEVYSFSFMNLLTYLLLVAGLVLVVLKMFNVVKSKIVDFVAMCLFVVSGIFFFLMPSFAVCPYLTAYGATTIQLGIGAILAGVFALVSACVLVLKAVLKK